MLRRLVVCAFLCCLAATFLRAQDAFTRPVGSEDQQIAIPQVTSAHGRKDAAALQEMISFLKTTRLMAFRDMKGTGTALLPGDDDSARPATLLLQGGDRLRLDIQTANGVRTILINGRQATVQHENKSSYSLPPAAASIGTVAFPGLALADFSSGNIVLIDRGMATVDGVQLHRITMQSAFSRKRAANSGHDVDLATDLYFTADTHLLVKSASAILLTDGGSQPYLQVVTYGDYREVNGMLLPFEYHETLNGQREWSLQLTEIHVNSGIDSTVFTSGREH